MGGSWVGGSWVVGRSKFVLGLRSCLFPEFPVVDKKRVRVRDP